MDYPIRTITQDQLEAFRRQTSLAFHNTFNPEHLEVGRPLFEFDRNIAAFDGETIIGTAGIFSTQMTVPGGSVPIAAVTMVGVRPTHRRRGILTGLMRQQIEGIQARGEPIATLWASESTIYGRFGYGVAIEMEIVKLTRAYTSFRANLSTPPGAVRLLTKEEAKEVLPPLHERIRVESPGELSRPENWWDIRILFDNPDWRDGMGENRYAVYEGPTGPEGYARYRAKNDFRDWLPNANLVVEELHAANPDARIALWRYIFGIDLVETFELPTGPMDEPLTAMLADPRRLQRSRLDAIWLRVVDVEQALSARKYRTEGRLVFEITPGFLPTDAGRYELEGGPDGAVCRRTDASPDITIGIEELGAIYLGGARLDTLARAGRIHADPAAIDRADLMFSWPRLPYCQEHF